MPTLYEPFAVMDKKSSMWKELKSIVANYRIPHIMVTHDTREITNVGDRVCLLENGKIATKGKADEFLAKRMIRAASLTILGPRVMAAHWRHPNLTEDRVKEARSALPMPLDQSASFDQSVAIITFVAFITT
jgi:ABC-type sulfate/molybdate transport systems ATPase subunit